MISRYGFARRMVPALASSLLTALFLLASIAMAGEGAAPPKGFRSWAHTKSTVVADKGNPLHGVHNQYANESALRTLRKGGEYKDGATFVDSVNAVVETNGIYAPGPKAKTLVMIKDRNSVATGGWIFQAFDPAGKPLKIDPVKDCFDCHLGGAKDSGFVFHKYAE
jgi:hypothetical protein